VAKNSRLRRGNPADAGRTQDAERIAKRNRTIVWALVVVVAVGAVAFFPTALLTDRPAFCKTCHTMVPFFDAWQQGAHKDVWCIDCHVDPGMARRLEHKFVALNEVYAQFFKNARFPNYNADVPDARCLRCHPDVPTQTTTPTSKFSHVTHLNKGVACAKCHASTGHKVTFVALQNAGLLNTANAPAGLTYVGQELRASQDKPSALPGHKPVPCSSCHDQANLQCSFCHATPANHYGADCKSCHRPTVPFANFVHPPSGEHNYRSRPCAACHPNGYQNVYCTCHKGNPPKGD
jgi:nitrate/TMAO reductase-like tetraheme cytochrome c subunit